MAVFGYKAAQPLLQSSRPADAPGHGFPDPPSAPGLSAFYARLWEDPLLECYRHAPGDEPSKIWSLSDYATCRQSPVWKWLHAKQNSEVVESFSKTFKDKQLLFLPVMLPGTPFGDDHETRLRTAYALHFALAASGYDLNFPTRMSFVDVPVEISVQAGGAWFTGTERQFRVPIKLFRKSSSAPSRPKQPDMVVVLWINEDLCQDRPLNVIAQILFGLVNPSLVGDVANRKWCERASVRVLGPTDSNCLKTILAEPETCCKPAPCACNLKLRDFAPSAVYSPWATVDFDETAIPSAAEPPIYRTTSTESTLADKLLEELQLRGALQESASVVLLTEHDTLFGTHFGPAFARASKNLVKPDKLLRMKYLRGLDGALPRSRQAESSSASSESELPQKPAANEGAIDDDQRPEGRAQKDYLARLERVLIDYHNDERMQGHSGVTAIGVIGSDVYDKLLVLRALRKRFSNVVFFTTGLDAAFSKPSEWQTTRNLIVASHFGLRLHNPLQGETPPFRDSYQTATYLSALHALNDGLSEDIGMDLKAVDSAKRADALAKCKPLVFEIGNEGPYQLTLTNDPDDPLTSAIQPRSPRENIGMGSYVRTSVLLALAIVSITLCAGVYISSFRRAMAGDGRANRRKLFFREMMTHFGSVALFAFLPWLVILADHRRGSGQPFSMHQGISLWPATLIRYLAFAVAVYLITTTFRELRALQKRLDLDWDLGAAKASRHAWRTFTNARRESWTKALDFAWRHSLVFNWPEVRAHWARHPRWNQPRSSSRELYEDFVERGYVAFRWMRVVPLIVAFLIFGMLIIYVCGSPANPYRGPWSHWTSVVTISGASLAMTTLAFLVIDAIQLCRRFLGALKHAQLDWNSRALDHIVASRGDNSKPDDLRSQSLFTLRIMVESSNVVGKLVRYPFIVVFLMVISRLPAFDYLDLNWCLVLLWTLLLSMAGWSAYQLRQAAADTREEILQRLHEQLAAIKNSAQKEQQRLAIEAIENEQGGAFGSPWSDPLLTAVAIPFGGSTLLLLIQQVLPHLIL
jgi:hypothetical protein